MSPRLAGVGVAEVGEPRLRLRLRRARPWRPGSWLAALAGKKDIAIDGHVLRGSGDGDEPPVHLLAAITHGEGVAVAQHEGVEQRSEIPGAPVLLEPVDVEGTTVTADAMHTQQTLARFAQLGLA